MQNLRAIVLRRRDQGESDRRLTLFTLEEGKLDAIAKGARKSASRLASASEPLSVAEITLVPGKRNRFITQAQPTLAYKKLRTDYDRLTQGLALVELYAAVLPYEQPVPELFELLETSLRYLEEHPKPLVSLAWSQMMLLMESGFMPSLDVCVVDGGKIEVADPFVSPQAGGFVSETSALTYTDRYRVKAEVLYGLSRIAELEKPPQNLKFVEESIVALLPFWKQITDFGLAANESLCDALRTTIHSRVQ